MSFHLPRNVLPTLLYLLPVPQSLSKCHLFQEVLILLFYPGMIKTPLPSVSPSYTSVTGVPTTVASQMDLVLPPLYSKSLDNHLNPFSQPLN